VAQQHPCISDRLAEFIAAQPMFFVATATKQGRINLSPKGLDGTFKLLTPNRVAWLNLTGSGNETAAHLRQDSRITIMFCAFSGAPLILRLYGKGQVYHRRDAEWGAFEPLFPDYPAKRQIVVIEIDSVITSCGFGVPEMNFVAQRPALPQWAERKGPEGIAEYWQAKNLTSFDGHPTGLLETPPKAD